MDASSQCICATVRRASRSITAAYDAALAPTGLRVTQFAVLRTLSRLGPVAVTRLAAEAALERSTMGRNLDPLERRGLVQIASGEADHRERIVQLTQEGVAAIAQALPHWQAAQDRVSAIANVGVIIQLAHQLAVLHS